jgi:phage shock protein A
MIHTLTKLEKLISEAERRKKFLEQGVEALRETLNEADAELQSLKANADSLHNSSVDQTQTIETQS